ncbi:WD40-repeat-containing domain protein [Trichoderma austrokoningii]
MIASGSDDEIIRVWNITSGEPLLTLEEHEDPITTIAFSPTGQVLASGSDNGRVRAWNLTLGEKLPKHRMKGAKCKFFFHCCHCEYYIGWSP